MSNIQCQIGLILVLTVLMLGGCVSPALAQSPQQTTQNTQNVLNSLLNSLGGCLIAGTSLIPGEPCQEEHSKSQSLLKSGGALGFVGLGISTVSTPPLSSTEALADFRNSLGFVDTAYAQNVTGSGSRVIAPVKTLWQIMRNLSYMLYIILFLVIGLMLMFRQKMNPQTVISVQAALPGLIIGLILITFSYLIAALLVDLAFLFIPIVALIFDQASPTNLFKANPEFWKGTAIESNVGNYKTLFDLSQNANIFSFWKAVTYNMSFNFDLFGNTAASFEFKTTEIIASLLNMALGLVKIGANLLVAVVIIIGLFIQMIRLFVSLARAYITIMIFTFLGPFMILMASIPGRGKLLENWWKTILANSLIFPAVFAGFFFGGLILDPATSNNMDFQYTLPFFSGLPVQVIKYIIGLMIILGIPAVPGMVKEALGVKDMKGFPEAFLQGAGSGFAPVKEFITKPFARIDEERKAYRDAALKSKYPYGSDAAARAARNTARPWVKWFNGGS